MKFYGVFVQLQLMDKPLGYVCFPNWRRLFFFAMQFCFWYWCFFMTHKHETESRHLEWMLPTPSLSFVLSFATENMIFKEIPSDTAALGTLFPTGIPRLRQLLMAGSVKNPVIRIPIATRPWGWGGIGSSDQWVDSYGILWPRLFIRANPQTKRLHYFCISSHFFRLFSTIMTTPWTLQTPWTVSLFSVPLCSGGAEVGNQRLDSSENPCNLVMTLNPHKPTVCIFLFASLFTFLLTLSAILTACPLGRCHPLRVHLYFVQVAKPLRILLFYCVLFNLSSPLFCGI